MYLFSAALHESLGTVRYASFNESGFVRGRKGKKRYYRADVCSHLMYEGCWGSLHGEYGNRICVSRRAVEMEVWIYKLTVLGRLCYVGSSSLHKTLSIDVLSHRNTVAVVECLHTVVSQ